MAGGLQTVRFQTVIDKLAAAYGPPKRPAVTDPLQMILLENVAYLAGDEQRLEAFQALRQRIGVTPEAILSASPRELLEVARLGGILAEGRVEKLRRTARIARQKFGSDLRAVVKQPLPEARKSLKLFPGIGDPGAEKILLFSGAHPILALDSHGLRVMTRVGFGREGKSYATTYRSAQEAVREELPADCSWLRRAHLLLRRHGQQVCRRSRPQCGVCAVSSLCRYYQERGVS